MSETINRKMAQDNNQTNIYIGLIHYPVYNKNNEIIASSITAIDLHDISRLAKTYDINIFFVITPLTDQQMLAEQIKNHWTCGYGSRYNIYRKEAIELIEVLPNLQDVIRAITKIENQEPLVIATDASSQKKKELSWKAAHGIIHNRQPVLILFGTAWGLEKSVFDQADYILEPIPGNNIYNHLSVRAAAAIILDRLIGR